MEQIIVIGAGAAGLTAAIFAARNGAKVTVLEHTDKAGKKILSTGNGKCNITNSQIRLFLSMVPNKTYILYRLVFH